jgi:penicillin-binding protein 1A
VRLAQDVGLDNVIAAARDLGIDAKLPKVPSLALGSADVNLLNLTAAFAGIVAGQAPVQPWGVSSLSSPDRPRRISVGAPSGTQRSLGDLRERLIELLKLPVERGTARGAALNGFAAGKTGTSQNHRDAWFIGFNESLIVGVWVGNDDQSA